MKSYAQKLQDPKWKSRRLEIIARDGFACQKCGADDGVFDVHHKAYEYGLEPWEYDDIYLITLCRDCHSAHHSHESKDLDKQLINSIKIAGFFSENLPDLIEAFRQMEMPYPSDVVAAAIFNWFKDSNKMVLLVDAYFQFLEAKKNV